MSAKLPEEERVRRRRAGQKRYREQNAARIAAGKLDWKRRNREHVAQHSKEYRDANRERLIATQKAYREANRDKVHETVAEWKRRNPERVYELNRAYALRHPERHQLRMSTAGARRRARVLGAVGNHTAAEWSALAGSYSGLCVYCLEPATTRDHVDPLALGGSNDIGNIVPACRSCNSSKNDTPLLRWLAERETPLEKCWNDCDTLLRKAERKSDGRPAAGLFVGEGGLRGEALVVMRLAEFEDLYGAFFGTGRTEME